MKIEDEMNNKILKKNEKKQVNLNSIQRIQICKPPNTIKRKMRFNLT